MKFNSLCIHQSYFRETLKKKLKSKLAWIHSFFSMLNTKCKTISSLFFLINWFLCFSHRKSLSSHVVLDTKKIYFLWLMSNYLLLSNKIIFSRQKFYDDRDDLFIQLWTKFFVFRLFLVVQGNPKLRLMNEFKTKGKNGKKEVENLLEIR